MGEGRDSGRRSGGGGREERGWNKVKSMQEKSHSLSRIITNMKACYTCFMYTHGLGNMTHRVGIGNDIALWTPEPINNQPLPQFPIQVLT